MSTTFLSARWEDLVMANYAVEPAVLQPFLPKGVELDLFDGVAYVSLVGFMFRNTRLFGLPIPFMGTFEEINLRFYVKRTEGSTIKRGVVFINETVPYRPVAWLANKLYKEHYIAIPTRSNIVESGYSLKVRYEWKIKQRWNHVLVNANISKKPMADGSMEAFIFEHYYGYTKINAQETQEYRVNHASWLVHTVYDYAINCDFTAMYGECFSFLNDAVPHSVLLAEGSQVTVDWNRKTIESQTWSK